MGVHFTENENGWAVGQGGAILNYSTDVVQVQNELLSEYFGLHPK